MTNKRKQPADRQRFLELTKAAESLVTDGSATTRINKHIQMEGTDMKKTNKTTTNSQKPTKSHRKAVSMQEESSVAVNGPMDIARACEAVCQVWDKAGRKYTLDDIAEAVGVCRRSVSRVRRLLKLPECLHAAVNAREISQKHATRILDLDSDTLSELVAEVESGADVVTVVERILDLPPSKPRNKRADELTVSELIERLLTHPGSPLPRDCSRLAELTTRLEGWRLSLEAKFEAMNAVLNAEIGDDSEFDEMDDELDDDEFDFGDGEEPVDDDSDELDSDDLDDDEFDDDESDDDDGGEPVDEDDLLEEELDADEDFFGDLIDEEEDENPVDAGLLENEEVYEYEDIDYDYEACEPDDDADGSDLDDEESDDSWGDDDSDDEDEDDEDEDIRSYVPLYKRNKR